MKMPQKWDKEADVIVIGFGGAGATAAITAHDLGAKVLIIEKMLIGGGNASTSGGHFICPKNVDDFVKYFQGLSTGHEVEREMVRVYAEYMVQNADWFRKLGGSSVEVVRCLVPGHYRESEFPNLPGSKGVPCYTLRVEGKRGRGVELFKILEDNVKSRGIEVLYNTPAKQLVTSPEREVVAVMSERQGRVIAIKARKAVILACGGFENNKEMKANYLGYTWTLVQYAGTPGNTGDGIKMATRIGADLWHMNNVTGPFLSFKSPGYANTMHGLPLSGWGYICVNKYGKRFGREMHDAVAWAPSYIGEPRESMHGKGMEHIFYCDYMHPQRIEYPNIPCYVIFDETTRLKSGGGRKYLIFATPISPPTYYLWSDELTVEIDKGWIVGAETVRKLATKTGLDPAALEETINSYNKYCEEGKDLDYFRPKETLISLKNPPYYAMELLPTILNTQGGPKRNAKCQVLNTDNNPISRLYSAGEMGSIFGFLYNAGGNIAEAFATGRIAGENAVKEKPWQ